MVDYNWDDSKEGRITKKITDSVLLSLTNFINIKYNIFEKTVAEHAKGAQIVYDEVQVLSARVRNLENAVEPNLECGCDDHTTYSDCPFCGESEELYFNPEDMRVECSSCKAVGPKCDTQCDAVIEWNNRA